MKDPLNTEQTPYEILDLEVGTTEESINKAFMAGLQKKRNVQKLTRARTILQNKEQRAMLDLFHYDPHVLSGLNPNPLKDKSALNLDKRMATANAWENQLKSVFPDNRMVQTLAVFWYWWAMWEEERFSEAMKLGKSKFSGHSSNPPINQMWHRVVAYWGTLISDLNVWCNRKGFSDLTIETLKDTLESRLRSHFHELGQVYYANGLDDHADRYSKLTLELTSELKTAREIARVGVRTNRGEICCGRLMLEQVGLLAGVRNSVGEALRKKPTSSYLVKLRDVLSPYSSIAILIDNNRPDEAIDAIINLPAEERKKSEVKELEARALLERGRHQASLGNTIDALDAWERALKVAIDGNLVKRVQLLVASTSKDEAIVLQQHQVDYAIEILEFGLELIEDENLQILLRDLATERGIQTFIEAQRKAEKNGKMTREIMKAYEEGFADIKRGAKMGSKRAAENAKTAEINIIQARLLFSLISSKKLEVESGLEIELERSKLFIKERWLLRKVKSAAAKENWGEAIDFITRTIDHINHFGTSIPYELVKIKSNFYYKLSVKIFNLVEDALMSEDLSNWDAAIFSIKQATEITNKYLIPQDKDVSVDHRNYSDTTCPKKHRKLSESTEKSNTDVPIIKVGEVAKYNYWTTNTKGVLSLYLKKGELVTKEFEDRLVLSTQTTVPNRRMILVTVFTSEFDRESSADLKCVILVWLPPGLPKGTPVHIKLSLNEDGIFNFIAQLNIGLKADTSLLRNEISVSNKILRIKFEQFIYQIYVGRFKEEYENIDRESNLISNEQLDSLKRTLDDLKAAELNGSEDAKKYLKEAAKNIQDVELNFLVLPEKTCALIRDADSAADENKYDQAIRCIEQVFNQLSPNPPKEVRNRLAEFYYWRGYIYFYKEYGKIDHKYKLISNQQLESLKGTLEDLRKAQLHGSEDAEKYLKEAADKIKDVESSFLVLPENTCTLIKDADAAADENRWDKAILCIKQVFDQLSPDPPKEVRNRLAEFYYQRGVLKFEKEYKSIDRANNLISHEQLDSLKRTLDDLKAAELHGSEDAKKYLKEAAINIQDVESNLLVLPIKIKILVIRAYEEADKWEAWDEAINYIEEAISQLGSNPPKELQDKLSEYLYERGIVIFEKIQNEADMVFKIKKKVLLISLKKGLSDLKRSEDLGSKDAAEKVAEAQKIFEQVIRKLNAQKANKIILAILIVVLVAAYFLLYR